MLYNYGFISTLMNKIPTNLFVWVIVCCYDNVCNGVSFDSSPRLMDESQF
jgi:hypothetical protein